MGGVSCEKGVLKLVYPGGSVEVHKEAITAAEVMKRNPRHCITRPDVFKYPWIVVRPESILSTGRVFFVVPYHTIRRLLQSNGIMPKTHSTDYKQQKQPPKHRLNGNSDIGLCKQTLPKETNDIMWGSEVAIMVDESLSNRRQGKTLYEQHEHYGCQPLIESTRIQSRRRKNVSRYEYEDDYERRRVNSFDNIYGSHVVTNVPKEKENPTKVANQQKKRSQEIRQEEKKRYPTAHWPLKEIHSSRTYPIHENRVGGTFFEENHKKNREVNNLKSCLRKPGICYPKRRDLKVTFVIPGDDDVKRVEIE